MHPTCHATCGLPDDVARVADLPDELKGLAPTCSVFCQRCAVGQLRSGGALSNHAAQMLRDWDKKLTILMKEVNEYQVSRRESPPLAWPLCTASMRSTFHPPSHQRVILTRECLPAHRDHYAHHFVLKRFRDRETAVCAWRRPVRTTVYADGFAIAKPQFGRRGDPLGRQFTRTVSLSRTLSGKGAKNPGTSMETADYGSVCRNW